jgi:hypothetical protein
VSDALRVVHVVRRGDPLPALERFLDSYRSHEAGVEHQLVLLCKGFTRRAELAPVLERLGGLAAEHLEVPDDGYDLTAYRRAAERFDGGTACFLNSHSTVLCPGWLERMRAGLTADVGMVGATGSWYSAQSNARLLLGLPGPYSELIGDRGWYRAQMGRLEAQDAGAAAGDRRSARPLRALSTVVTLLGHLALFGPFPSSHVRTNAFLIRNETMGRLRFPVIRTKLRAHQLESGRGSISAQLHAMGLETVVAGRDGVLYRSPQWPDSDTFWQAGQGNLLVADNQTERSLRADLELRTLLAKTAWGTRARPAARA